LPDTTAGERLRLYLSRRAHAVGLVERHDLRRRLCALIDAEVSKALDGSPDLEDQLMRHLPYLGEANVDLAGVLKELLPADRAVSDKSAPPRARFASASWYKNNTPGGDVVWPEGATHMLRRKGCASFIRYAPDRGTVDLLPGSVMRAATRASFPQHHQSLRHEALVRGYLVGDGDLLRVAAALPLETPSTASTFVSGTVENGWTAWRDRDGMPIPRELSRERRLRVRRLAPSG
jgi:hypothetical protein